MLRFLKTNSFIMGVIFLFSLIVPIQVQAETELGFHSYFTNTVSTTSLSIPHYTFAQFDMSFDSVVGDGITAHTYLSLSPQSDSVDLSFSEATIGIKAPFNKVFGEYMDLSMLNSIDLTIGLHKLPFGKMYTKQRFEKAYSDTPLAMASVLAPMSLEGAVFHTPISMIDLKNNFTFGIFNGGDFSSGTVYTAGFDTSLEDMGLDIGLSGLLKAEDFVLWHRNGITVGLDLTYPLMEKLLLTTELISDLEASSLAAYALLGYEVTDIIDLGLRYDYLDGESSDTLPLTVIASHSLFETSFFRFQYSLKDETLLGDIVVNL